RVDAHDLAAIASRLLQLAEHARVTRPGVLSNHEDRVSVREILQFDRGFADADRFGQSRAARLVTQVGAIRQVVRAELTGKESVQEGGLVTGAAGGVERGLVR